MRRIWFTGAAAVCLLGCGYDDGPVQANPGYACGQPVESVIDKGAEIDADPGAGVGVVYEYLDDGKWRITTSCDTPSSGYSCSWDLLVWPAVGGQILDFEVDSLEAGDGVVHDYDGSLHFVAMTDSDLDSVTFEATSGATLRFDALLDNYCANAYMFWIGDGALHSGSPSNPIDLTPSP